MSNMQFNIYSALDNDSDDDYDDDFDNDFDNDFVNPSKKILYTKTNTNSKANSNANSNSMSYDEEVEINKNKSNKSTNQKSNDFKSKNDFRSKLYSGLKINKDGVLDELSDLPGSINEAYKKRKNLTLKQITTIMNLNGLWGEMYNVIHDHIQKKVRRHQIKITHNSRVFYVSLYNWYDLRKIEKMIEDLIFPNA